MTRCRLSRRRSSSCRPGLGLRPNWPKYDLGDRNTAKRNASFQVWGTRGPAQNPARSLGIFYGDDQKQNRWVLKFEDPRILAEIDSVFVTIEPPGGRCQAHGPQIPLRIPQRESQSSIDLRSVRTVSFATVGNHFIEPNPSQSHASFQRAIMRLCSSTARLR